MQLERDGAVRIAGALRVADLGALSSAMVDNPVVDNPVGRAGVRLTTVANLRSALSSTGVVGAIAADVLGAGSQPVHAILFDKTPMTNWKLGWHQDRTIAVAKRLDVEGFGPWSIKDGVIHVEPPFELLERMVTLPVHLDQVGIDNGPLLIAPGSHQLGRVPVVKIAKVVDKFGVHACLADAGDVWV